MQRMRQFLRPLVAAVALVVAFSAAPTSVSAHTDVQYTVPADGEQVAEPVAEITVAFDDPVTLAGSGFQVLTPAGDVIVPSVFSEDGAVYFLSVPEPLAGGVAAVKYDVAAADGHVLEGGFSFTVPAADATATVPAGSTVAQGSTLAAPAGDVAADDGDDGGSSLGIVIGVVAAVALAGVALLLLRSRSSGSPRPT